MCSGSIVQQLEVAAGNPIMVLPLQWPLKKMLKEVKSMNMANGEPQALNKEYEAPDGGPHVELLRSPERTYRPGK